MAGSENILQILRDSIDANNVTFSKAAKQAGYLHQEEDLETVAISKEAYSGFVELHIEQGPTLEDEGKDLDLVCFSLRGRRILNLSPSL
jgi:ureidoglycolate amidohydrolase